MGQHILRVVHELLLLLLLLYLHTCCPYVLRLRLRMLSSSSSSSYDHTRASSLAWRTVLTLCLPRKVAAWASLCTPTEAGTLHPLAPCCFLLPPHLHLRLQQRRSSSCQRRRPRSVCCEQARRPLLLCLAGTSLASSYCCCAKFLREAPSAREHATGKTGKRRKLPPMLLNLRKSGGKKPRPATFDYCRGFCLAGKTAALLPPRPACL